MSTISYVKATLISVTVLAALTHFWQEDISCLPLALLYLIAYCIFNFAALTSVMTE